MPRIRWPMIVAASLAGCPALAIEFPDAFDDALHQVQIQYNGAGVPATTLSDAFTVASAFGAVSASADYASGQLKGRAFASDGPPVATLVFANFIFYAKNTSGTVAEFQQGDVRLDVSATFARSLGVTPGGTVGNTLVSSLAIAVDTGFSSAGNLIYQYTDTVDDDPPERALLPTFVNGGTWSGSADDSALDVVLFSPRFVVLPGETLAITASVSASATAFSFFGGTGFSATSDFGSTGQLAMALPAGFAITADAPLSWVTLTPVPEPAPASLMWIGLAALAAMAVRRSAAGRS